MSECFDRQDLSADFSDDDLTIFARDGAPPLPTRWQRGHLDHRWRPHLVRRFGTGPADHPACMAASAMPAIGATRSGHCCDAGYRVIVIDTRGHGRSTRDGQPYTYQLLASDVLAVMDSLGIATRRARRLERRRLHRADPGRPSTPIASPACSSSPATWTHRHPALRPHPGHRQLLCPPQGGLCRTLGHAGRFRRLRRSGWHHAAHRTQLLRRRPGPDFGPGDRSSRAPATSSSSRSMRPIWPIPSPMPVWSP